MAPDRRLFLVLQEYLVDLTKREVLCLWEAEHHQRQPHQDHTAVEEETAGHVEAGDHQWEHLECEDYQHAGDGPRQSLTAQFEFGDKNISNQWVFLE